MNRHRFITVIAASGKSLVSEISEYQNNNNLIFMGGIDTANWSTASNIGLPAATMINPGYAILQDGYVSQFKVNVKWFVAGDPWKFKIFRWHGSRYDLVYQQSFIPVANNSTLTVALTQPVLVKMSDVIGVFWPDHGSGNNDIFATTYRGTGYLDLRWDSSSNVNTYSTFPDSGGGGKGLNLAVYGNSPYLAVTGDSIIEGLNGTNNWYGYLKGSAIPTTLPGGEPTSEIAHQLRTKFNNVLQYQNAGYSGQNIAWVASTGLPFAIASKPHTILVHAGTNDIWDGTTWASFLLSLNSIKSACVSAGISQLLIDEILPRDNATDLQAATIRTFNSNIASWCASNGATLVLCHDEMAQIRVSTGYLDDMLTAYSQNIPHLSAAGVDKMAEIIKRYIK